MIKIICIGKIKEQYLKDLINDYSKRINKYHKLEIIELSEQKSLFQESLLIKKHMNGYNIALDINGKEIGSIGLANLIDKTFIKNSSINFIIGSSEGIDNSIKDSCDLLLSLSKSTFPHGLFRGILLEQIYRAFKINNNENYHK